MAQTAEEIYADALQRARATQQRLAGSDLTVNEAVQHALFSPPFPLPSMDVVFRRLATDVGRFCGCGFTWAEPPAGLRGRFFGPKRFCIAAKKLWDADLEAMNARVERVMIVLNRGLKRGKGQELRDLTIHRTRAEYVETVASHRYGLYLKGIRADSPNREGVSLLYNAANRMQVEMYERRAENPDYEAGTPTPPEPDILPLHSTLQVVTRPEPDPECDRCKGSGEVVYRSDEDEVTDTCYCCLTEYRDPTIEEVRAWLAHAITKKRRKP